ncbi:MAG: hypothetical protein GXO63_01845 [Candidatus Micrarchaeota archaeon]|nr:hypothetical protein [Candidatus Micrarchaeota archaeon]
MPKRRKAKFRKKLERIRKHVDCISTLTAIGVSALYGPENIREAIQIYAPTAVFVRGMLGLGLSTLEGVYSSKVWKKIEKRIADYSSNMKGYLTGFCDRHPGVCRLVPISYAL